MKKIFLSLSMTFCCIAAIAQKMTPAQYIDMHKELAIREMKRMGVPAAITLAQGLLETENGNSELLKKSNNHFGIKCKSSWTAAGVSHDDDAPGECFRTYKDAEASYRDHSNYLRGQDRYSFLFKLDPTDYKGWAYGLKKAGYATNPKYPAILIKYIEDNNLEQYTLLAVKDIPRFDASKYKDDPVEKATDEITAGTIKVGPADKMSEVGSRLTVNGSTAIYAEKGKSLLAIATENNINLAKLLEYNDLEKDGLLEKDQLIFLDKKSKEGKEDYYVVQRNETLYDVAQKNGIRLQNLYELNNLKEDNVSAGTRLRLRYDAPVQAEASTDKMIQKVHEVQPKEGLYAISKKYGVTVAQLKEWNNLADDNLKVGQQLIISK